MIPRRFVVRVVKHIVCFITLAQALDSLLICCPGCRTFVASFVDYCLYIFRVLTQIKLAAFSNLLNLSHGKVKQMGASVSTQFCPSHFILVLIQFLFIIIIFFFFLLPFLLLLFYYYLFITQKYRKWALVHTKK